MIKRLIEKLKTLRIYAIMRSADDIQELYCGNCDKDTKQKVFDSGHERDSKEELPDEAGCDFCRDEQGYTIGNMYVCDKCGRQVP